MRDYTGRPGWRFQRRKYAKYDLDEAKREFVFALQDSPSFQDFINRVQLIWQKYQQGETEKRQPVYLDQVLSQLLDLVYNQMTVPQRIKFAHALVQDVKRSDVKANISNARRFFDDLEAEMERARNAK